MNLSLSERSVSIESNGARYHVRVAGQGRALMLLHGFTGSSESWEAHAGELANRFALVRPDLLGHGQTVAPDDSERFTFARAAADLTAILDSLGIEKVGLHGYSMGGRLALYTALAYPDRVAALSLESASPGLETEQARATRHSADEALAQRILANGIEAFVDEWEQLPLFASQSDVAPAVRRRQRTLRLANNTSGLANSLRGMGTGTQQNLWPRLGELRMPVLLMTGLGDSRFSDIADRMAARIGGASRVTIPASGHTIHLENPQAWFASVTRFFASALT